MVKWICELCGKEKEYTEFLKEYFEKNGRKICFECFEKARKGEEHKEKT